MMRSKTVVPTILAPGVGFMEDNYSLDWCGWEGGVCNLDPLHAQFTVGFMFL